MSKMKDLLLSEGELNDYMVDLDGMWCGVEESFNRDLYDIAKGEELDKLAELWGLKRKVDMGEAESDAEFRTRIKDRIKEDSEPSELPTGKTQLEVERDRMRNFFFPKNDSSTFNKCECGLDSTTSGGGHSTWCPKYRGGL